MKLLTLLLLLGVAFSARDADLVTSLPDVDTKDLKIYSGYFKLFDAADAKQIHYMLVKQANDSATAPLVLWLNGGPGCSSLDGMLYENGPFYFEEDSLDAVLNEYSWHKHAHMLYFEAPAGVGFSVYGAESNKNFTDELTAHDNLIALTSFFSNFTEFKGRDFYISGESYAGIYVPWLAKTVLDWNAKNEDNEINLKGILVGNGVVNWQYDASNALAEFAYQRGLLEEYVYETYTENDCSIFSEKEVCSDIFTFLEGDLFENVNIYDVYRTCYYLQSPYKVNKVRFMKNLKLVPPCIDVKGATVYLNRADVKEALHVSKTYIGSEIKWEICTENINYSPDYEKGSYEIMKYLINETDVLVLAYSGDTDASVSTIGTRKWIDSLDLELTNPWRPWRIEESSTNIAGFAADYADKLTFVTIRGTGHMSIQWKRAEGTAMFKKFISGEDF